MSLEVKQFLDTLKLLVKIIILEHLRILSALCIMFNIPKRLLLLIKINILNIIDISESFHSIYDRQNCDFGAAYTSLLSHIGGAKLLEQLQLLFKDCVMRGEISLITVMQFSCMFFYCVYIESIELHGCFVFK